MKIRTVLILVISAVLLVGVAFPDQRVRAQEPDCTEERLLDLGVQVINCAGDSACTSSGASTSAQGLPVGSSIYILGDSISNQSREELQKNIVGAGYVVSKIEADGGRAITSDTYPEGGPYAPSGLEAAAADADIIKNSDAVIIALGTNSGNEDLSVQVPAQINVIRGSGFNGPIYWVNTFHTYGNTSSARNTIIAAEVSKDPNASVIDAFSAGIELSSDQTHPTLAGRNQFAELIVKNLQQSSSSPSSTSPEQSGELFPPYEIVGGESTDGNPTHILSYPTGLDEQKAANAIDAYIQERKPESPFVGLGPAFVAGGKKYNVNPLLAVGHLKIENGFATAGSGWHTTTPPSYNAFGRSVGSKTNGQPYVIYTTSSGRERLVFQWSSWQASLDGNNGTEDPWFAIINRKYLSKDYSGSFQIASGDFETYLSHYAPNSDGNNESEYVNGLKTTIDELISLMGTGVGFARTNGCGGQSTGSGNVSVDGYAFPLAPQTKAVGGITVGQQVSTHDGGAAFDLFSAVDSAVYSIYSGTPVTINTNFNDINGCSTIQFLADDGLYYWYGHLKDVIVQEGVRIEAGVQMAKIADASYGSGCVGGAPHLHIDRGCTIDGIPQRGGGDESIVATDTIPAECRDPEFIPFLSKLYETLP